MSSMDVDPPVDEGIADTDANDSTPSSDAQPLVQQISQPLSPIPQVFSPSPAMPEPIAGPSASPAPPAMNSSEIVSNQADGSTSIAVSLHPLVIMNVAEHWTRLRAQDDKSKMGVTGVLLGRQKGRDYEIVNSYEMLFNKDGINATFCEQKAEQFKQVFPDLEFIGWYSIGETPTELDYAIHKQVMMGRESPPIFLKLNPFGRHSKIPITIYETVFDMAKGEQHLLFSQINYTIVTEEAERIGLDHMARQSTTDNSGESGSSAVAEHLKCQESAIKMLRDRVRLIRDYVNDTRDGKVAWNHEIMREIHNLSSRLPLVSSPEFREEYFNQCNDVALMTYLGVLTKGTNTMNGFVSKFNTLYDRQGMGRRMRSLFY